MNCNRRTGLFRIAVAAASVVASVTISCSAAHAGKYKILYRFTGAGDGRQPFAAPVSDADGNLYGTTYMGGAGAGGTVWKLAPDGTESVLHSFAPSDGDGRNPRSGVTLDKKGNVYGTTVSGGTDDKGTVYRIHRNGAYDVVHSFKGQGHDGASPSSAVVLDKSGNIYGATELGGATSEDGNSGIGALYKLAPDGIATLLYSFLGPPGGAFPEGNLAQDSFGLLYGTTLQGGEFRCGTLFRLKGGKTLTILHSFRCDSAAEPQGVIRNKAGDLFGVTYEGGQFGRGVVYKYSNGLLHVLHDFDPCCGDGTDPNGRLSVDNSYVYGVTYGGGAYDKGTVFRLALSDGAITLLHSFAGEDDGRGPVGGITASGKYLYGTTQFGGGGSDAGTIFRVRK